MRYIGYDDDFCFHILIINENIGYDDVKYDIFLMNRKNWARNSYYLTFFMRIALHFNCKPPRKCSIFVEHGLAKNPIIPPLPLMLLFPSTLSIPFPMCNSNYRNVGHGIFLITSKKGSSLDMYSSIWIILVGFFLFLPFNFMI